MLEIHNELTGTYSYTNRQKKPFILALSPFNDIVFLLFNFFCNSTLVWHEILSILSLVLLQVKPIELSMRINVREKLYPCKY